jgi:hypothetical protein
MGIIAIVHKWIKKLICASSQFLLKKGSQNVDELLPELVFYLLQKTLSERVN